MVVIPVLRVKTRCAEKPIAEHYEIHAYGEIQNMTYRKFTNFIETQITGTVNKKKRELRGIFRAYEVSRKLQKEKKKNRLSPHKSRRFETQRRHTKGIEMVSVATLLCAQHCKASTDNSLTNSAQRISHTQKKTQLTPESE